MSNILFYYLNDTFHLSKETTKENKTTCESEMKAKLFVRSVHVRALADSIVFFFPIFLISLVNRKEYINIDFISSLFCLFYGFKR